MAATQGRRARDVRSDDPARAACDGLALTDDAIYAATRGSLDGFAEARSGDTSAEFINPFTGEADERWVGRSSTLSRPARRRPDRRERGRWRVVRHRDGGCTRTGSPRSGRLPIRWRRRVIPAVHDAGRRLVSGAGFRGDLEARICPRGRRRSVAMAGPRSTPMN